MLAGISLSAQTYLRDGAVIGVKNAASITNEVTIKKMIEVDGNYAVITSAGDTLKSYIPIADGDELFDVAVRKYSTDTLLITAALDTLESTAAGQYIRTANATKCAICVPDNDSVAFPIGTTIYFWNEGAGTLKFRPAAGVTINSELDSTEVANAHAPAYLIKRATNKWELGGSILN